MGLFSRLLGKKSPPSQGAPSGVPGAGSARPVSDQPEVRCQDRERPAASRAGIDDMIKVCLNRRHRLLSLEEYPLFNQAVEELKREGPAGARSLAALIDELLAARCAEIQDALAAASRLPPQPELVCAIQRVISAPPVITSQTLNTRFSPVIVGGDRIGWDDGTARKIKERATEALKALGVNVLSDSNEASNPQGSHKTTSSPSDTTSTNKPKPELTVTCVGCHATYRLGVDACVVTSEGVAADFKFVIVVGGDKVTGGNRDDPDLVAPYEGGRSADAKVLANVERLLRARAAKQARYWRCNPCGKVNRYLW